MKRVYLRYGLDKNAHEISLLIIGRNAALRGNPRPKGRIREIPRSPLLFSFLMPNQNRKIVAVVSDLMFVVKIQEAAKRAGLEITFAKAMDEAVEQARTQPAVMILDLNTTALDSLQLIERLKGADDTRDVNLLGFVSHVQVDLKQAAQEKGCNTVIARSAFSQNLPTMLRRYA